MFRDLLKKLFSKREEKMISPIAPTPTPNWEKIRNEIARKYRITPTPLPTPTVIPQFQNFNPPIQELIRKYFPENANEAINVAIRESSLNPSLTQQERNRFVPQLGRKSRDVGLFQINEWMQRENLPKAGFTIEDMYDPEKNVRFARWLYEKRGWQDWPATAGALGYIK